MTAMPIAATVAAAEAKPRRAAVLNRGLIAPAAPLPVATLQALAGLTPREAKKMDRFSLLTLAAVRPLVAAFDEDDRRDCGIVVGNAAGGWTFTEPQLRGLHAEGVASVSPYLASAWFPAAPQGQATIHLRLRGFAKTIATDRCAGMQAISHAASRIAAGRARLLLAGGTEAPSTPYVEAAIRQRRRDPALLAEAAAFLLLGESAGHGDEIRIEHHASWPLPRNGVRFALAERLQREREAIGELDHVVCCCDPADEGLMLLLRAVVRRTCGRRPIHFPLRELGDSLGASSAAAVHSALNLLAQAPGSVLVFTVGWQSAAVLLLSRELD